MNERTQSSRPRKLATIAARLDLSDEKQRFVHDAIRRTHTGRWPLWQALAMRQIGPFLVEAVRWRPRHLKERATFSVVRWDSNQMAVTWTYARSREAAIAALRSFSA